MAQANRSSGVVKWFSGQKGFGFITRDDGGEDLFVHQSSIRSEGYRSLSEGEPVEFEIDQGNDGRTKAVNVTGPNRSDVSGGGGRGRVYGGGGDYGGGYGRGGRGGGRGGRRSGGYGGGSYGGGGGSYGGGGGACYSCGQSGHLARDCPQGSGGGSRFGGGGGRFGGGGGGGCYNCGEEGHFARECPNEQK